MGKSTETLSAIVQFLTDRLNEVESVAQHADQDPTIVGVQNEYQYGRLSVSAAWLLADIAAKRAIIELHTEDWTDTGDVNLDSEICEYCRESWPCETLRLLASVHSGHPDYREAWKP